MPTYADDKLTVGITGRKMPSALEMLEIHPKIKRHWKAEDAAASLFAMQGPEISKESVGNVLVQCYEQEARQRWMYLTAGINNSVTTINVDDGASGAITGALEVDDIIVLEKADFSAREQMKVSEIVSTTQFKVVGGRGFGSSSAAAWLDNQPIRILGPVMKEDSTTPTIKNIIPTQTYNYCEQIRTAMGGTYRFVESNFYADANKLAKMRLDKWIDHLDKECDKALFSEMKAETTYGMTTQEGIISAILRRGGQHEQVGGNITYDKFLEICSDKVFAVGGSRKLAMMPNTMLSALEFWKKTHLFVMNDEEYLDLKVKRLELNTGTLLILREKRLQGGPLAPRGAYGSCFVTVDPENLRHCRFRNYDKKLLINQQAKGILGRIDEYLSDGCIAADVIKSHTLVSEITGFQA